MTRLNRLSELVRGAARRVWELQLPAWVRVHRPARCRAGRRASRARARCIARAIPRGRLSRRAPHLRRRQPIRASRDPGVSGAEPRAARRSGGAIQRFFDGGRDGFGRVSGPRNDRAERRSRDARVSGGAWMVRAGRLSHAPVRAEPTVRRAADAAGRGGGLGARHDALDLQRQVVRRARDGNALGAPSPAFTAGGAAPRRSAAALRVACGAATRDDW